MGKKRPPIGKIRRKFPGKNKERKSLILITGSVGTGKSSVSKALAKLVSHKTVEVGKIVLQNKKTLSSGFDKERDSAITDIKKTRAYLKKKGLLSKGHIVESHYSQELVDRPDWVFVLRCEPKELDKRLMKREYPEKKRAENIVAEILDSCLVESEEKFGKDCVIEVDTTGKTPSSVAGEIALFLRTGVVPKRGAVDYVEKYLGKGFDSKKLSFRLKP